MKTIDINADLGEGFLFDTELMPLLSSCNIACGGHTGTENSMRATIQLAKKHNVTIGAHPSYPDPDHFGRKDMEISDDLLKKNLQQQILTLINVAREERSVVRYVKPHGALYNKANKDEKTAQLLIDVVKNIEPSVALMGMPNTILEKLAKQHYIMYIKEGFADRAYNTNNTLVSRKIDGAVLHTPKLVWQQVQNMVLHQKVETLENTTNELTIDSICFHGDTPEALKLVTYVAQELKKQNIVVKNVV